MSPAPHRLCPSVLTFAAFAAACLGADKSLPAPLPAAPPPSISPSAAAPASGPAAPSAVPVIEKPAAAKTKGKAGAADAKAPAPPPLSPRFQQVRDRIKVLYGYRDQKHLPLDPRENPFRTQAVGATEPATAATGSGTPAAKPTAAPALTDVNALRLAVASLRLGGSADVKDRLHIFINGVLYQEGDVLKVPVQNQPVLLRITKLSRLSITFTFNAAELEIRR